MRRHLLVALGVVGLLAAPPAVDPVLGQPLLVPRVIEGRVTGLSLDRVDVELVVGLTASRDVTLRRLAFLDSRVGETPVAVEESDGEWPLTAGVETVLDRPVRVRAYAKDLAGIASLADLMARDVVRVHATVEVSFATPWPARLLLMGPSQVAISEVTLDVPMMAAGRDPLSQLLRVGATAAGMISAYALPTLTHMQLQSPQRRELGHRLAASTATVVTSYAIAQGAGVRVSRSVRSLGFWWTSGTFCTTREGLEPWRFDTADATVLEHGKGRLDKDAISITMVTAGREWRLDARRLLGRLPRAAARRRYVQVGSGLRRITLLDRTADSNLICLTGLDGVSAGAGATATPAMAVAAAVAGQRTALAWTDIRESQGQNLTLTAPVASSSFGSPLMSQDGVVGIVVSATQALSAGQLAKAASRPVPVRIQAA